MFIKILHAEFPNSKKTNNRWLVNRLKEKKKDIYIMDQELRQTGKEIKQLNLHKIDMPKFKKKHH